MELPRSTSAQRSNSQGEPPRGTHPDMVSKWSGDIFPTSLEIKCSTGKLAEASSLQPMAQSAQPRHCLSNIVQFDLQAKGRGISVACISVTYLPQKTYKIESTHLLGCMFSLQSKAMDPLRRLSNAHSAAEEPGLCLQ